MALSAACAQSSWLHSITSSLNGPHRPARSRNAAWMRPNCARRRGAPHDQFGEKFQGSDLYSSLFGQKLSTIDTVSTHGVGKLHSRQTAARASSNAEASTSNTTVSQELQEQKAAVLRAVANTNRGKNTTPRQRRQILDLIEIVEKQNPIQDPIRSPLISGTWSLLYTASTKEEFTYAGTEEGPFLARVKPVAFGQVRSKGSTQIIQSEKGVVDNIAEFTVFGKPGSLAITGSFAPAAPLPDRGAVRLDVKFESFTLKFGWLKLRVPLTWVNPTGWIDTTYLDSELRIGRGDKGSVFVTVRRK